MNVSSVKTKEDEIWEGLYPRIPLLIRKNKWSWETFGAAFGLGGGILSFMVAAALQIIVLFPTADVKVLLLERISFICFIIFLPLMLLGAHFLDLIEEKNFNA